MYDLDTLQAEAAVLMPSGHYPRSIAASWNAYSLLRRGSPVRFIPSTRLTWRATPPPHCLRSAYSRTKSTLTQRWTASPDGWRILAASANGTVILLYDAGANHIRRRAGRDFTRSSPVRTRLRASANTS